MIWLGRICAAEARIAAGLADDDASKNTASAAIADARSEMRVSLQDLEDSLTASAAHLCCEVLRGVSGVKQVLATYRMTDRPAPTEPSVYVDESLDIAALGCFAFEAGVPKGLSSAQRETLLKESHAACSLKLLGSRATMKLLCASSLQ